MKKTLLLYFILSSFMIVETHAQSTGAGKEFLLQEIFTNIQGDEKNLEPVDVSKFDVKGEWNFTEVYAGDQCIMIKKGGTITLPAIPELYGNAAFWFYTDRWEPEGLQWWNPESPEYKEYVESLNNPHRISVSHGGLNVNEIDEGLGMQETPCIHDGTSESRITFTAGHDVKIRCIEVWYGKGEYGMGIGETLFKYSHDTEGIYYRPFDLTLSWEVWGYNGNGYDYVVYTTDGSAPTRKSQRYDGSIHITETTTITPAVVKGDGDLIAGWPHTFTFVDKNEKPTKPENTFEVTVTPGKLKSQLLDIDADVIEGLIIKGQINGDDIKYITDAEGRTAAITYLDLSDVTLAFDGTLYRATVDGPPGGMGTYYYKYYYMSETNYDESQPVPRPGTEITNCYRNNLEAAFRDREKLETVILPKSMTEIGGMMFYNCRNLKFCPISDDVTVIGGNAFNGAQLHMYNGLPKSIEKIGPAALCGAKIGILNIPKKMEIGASAFAGAEIVSLDLPFPCDSIYDGTFASESLKEINIGEGVKYIGAGAFGWAPIEKATLPESLREIGYGAFYESAPFLKNIEPEGGIRYIGKTAYQLVDNKLEEYTVKEGTVSIVDQLFYWVQASKFNLPASLEIIGGGAFWGAQITSLPSMPGIKRIYGGAFGNCQKLARVELPESLEYLENAFDGCDALWSLTYNAIDCECPYGVSPRDLERIVIGDKVRRLPRGLYTGNTNITEVTLPKSVEIIDANAFEYCKNLEYIGLSDNITTISDFAFNGCTSLTGIHWPLNLETIGSSAFRECKSLTTVSLPEGVKKVENGAFFLCTNVDNIYLASTIEELGYDALCFYESGVQNVTITSPAAEPIPYEWRWYDVTPTIKVPYASIDKYRADAFWSGSQYGKENNIISIEQITVTEEASTTSFADVTEETDLSDTVIGDVYVTIGENDEYDSTDGSIVLNNTMTEEEADAIGGMAPGVTDLNNRYNGLVVMVPAGKGTVAVNCLTAGTRQLAVKIGEGEPQTFTKSDKGEVIIDYDVTEDTYVYVYATDPGTSEAAARRAAARAGETDNFIKIYSLGVNPLPDGIKGIYGDNNGSPVIGYYTIDGVKVNKPSAQGIYVVRRADGTTTKVIVK